MNMDIMKKTVEKIELKKSLTLEEIYQLMMESSKSFPGKFKLKKGLIGKAINFDVFMKTEPKITLKAKVVTIRRIGSTTSVGIGSMPAMNFKAIEQTVASVKDGGLGKAVTGGAEYFSQVCDAMQELLKDYE